MTLQETSEEQLLAQVSDLREKIAAQEQAIALLQQDNRSLRESAKILDSLVHASPEPMVVYDSQGCTRSVNPAFVELFGWSKEELLGRRIDYVPEECRAETRETMERSLRGELVPPFETKRLTKDGRIVDIQISAALFCDDEGRPAGHIVTLRDIGMVKLCEQARLKTEEEYRFLTERIRDIVWTADLNLRPTYVSPSIEQALGYTPEERLVQGPEDTMTPESFERARALLMEELAIEQACIPEPDRTVTVELEFYRKDGASAWFENKMTAIRDEAGQIVGIHGISRDISDRKSAEDALRDSEQRYSSLLNSTTDLAFLKDETSRYVMINRACEDFFGRPEADILGKTDFDLMPPYAAENCLVSDREALDSQGMVLTEEEFEGRIFEVKKFAVTLTSGKQGIGGLIREASERKRIEQALRESERKYRLLVDHVQESILVAQDGILKFVNPKTVELFDWDEDDLLSKPFLDFVHPDDRDRVHANHMKRLQKEGSSDRYPFRIIDKSGAIRWVEIEGVAIEWEGRPAALGFMSDITERRNSEEALRASEDRYRTLVENLNDVIFSADEEGRITYISPVFERKGKYTCQEVLGRRFTDFVHPDDLPRLIERYAQIMEGELGPSEYRLVDKDGRIVHVLSHSRPVYREGKIVGLTGLMTDITERKKGEEERAVLKDQLREAQKMEAIGTLAGGIAHDFNNLLQVTLGYAEVMLVSKPADDPDREDLGKIRQAALSGAELVKGLLTFSRRVKSAPTPMNLNLRIEKMEQLLRRTIPRMIDMRFELAPDLKKTNGDPAQIEQILVNLVINARDAMPNGGVLTVGTRNVTLEESAASPDAGCEPGDYVLLYVSDTGHGMSEQTQARIFEPFYTTKELGRGTGLGLAVVYGIVQQHHGCIKCSSEPGRGTTFRILLRAMDDHVRPLMPEAPSIAASGTETVLLVDDESAVRELGTRILRKAGYTVLAAENGRQALEIFRQERDAISLVILDLIMPQMSGVDCLREILAIDAGTRVLIASGHAADAARQECLGLGARGFVGKPFRLRRLLDHVRNALDRQ